MPKAKRSHEEKVMVTRAFFLANARATRPDASAEEYLEFNWCGDTQCIHPYCRGFIRALRDLHQAVV